MMAIGPLAFDNDTILVAIRRYSPTAPANAPYTYVSASLDRRPCKGASSAQPYCAGGKCCAAPPAAFYAAVLEHQAGWRAVFEPGLEITLPYAERRQIDMAKGVMVSTSTVWIGDRPNYGTGVYWLGSPPVRSMMDTVGIPDSLPLTSLSLDNALLEWGLFDDALAKVGFYLDTFVYQNGTIDMGHWKDVWKDAGDGVYNCTYPDGLTDMGKLLQLYTDTVRFSRDTTWMTAHLGPALRIGRYLLRSRAAAVAAFPPGDPRHGLIYGPAEHDTCSMGMGPVAGGNGVPTFDGQYMLYYFSVSMWHWRGMVELGNLLLDYPAAAAAAGDPDSAKLAATLLAEAVRFKADIDDSLTAGSVRLPNGTLYFVPAAAVPAGTTVKPYPDMTSDVLASYSNFRYYAEQLSSGAMDAEFSEALMNFRENSGGTLSGMTRYTDHLDDMPAIGYAISSLAADRIDRFLLLLHGHTANYQGRGSFMSDEQQSLYQNTDAPAWRSTLGDLQASFCTPSQTLAASMTAMQFVSTDRDNATIWVARGAPSRWYAPAPAPAPAGSVTIGAKRAPSRWGTVNFTMAPQAASVAVTVAVDFVQPAGARVHPPTLMLKVRAATATDAIKSATVTGASTDCEIIEVRPDAEIVVVRPTAAAAKAMAVKECAISVLFAAKTPRGIVEQAATLPLVVDPDSAGLRYDGYVDAFGPLL